MVRDGKMPLTSVSETSDQDGDWVSQFGLVVKHWLVSRKTSVQFHFGSPFSSKGL